IGARVPIPRDHRKKPIQSIAYRFFSTATSETSAALTHPPHEVRASKNRLLAQQSFRPPHQGVNLFPPFLNSVALLLFVFVLLIDTRDAGLRACDMSE